MHAVRRGQLHVLAFQLLQKFRGTMKGAARDRPEKGDSGTLRGSAGAFGVWGLLKVN